VFLGGSNGDWQSDNIDDELQARNIRTANGIVHIQNLSGTMGGPVKRDKLWFFIAGRHISTDESVANVPEEIILPDGTIIRSILDQFIRDVGARLTWQGTPKHKLAAWFSRVFKCRKDFGFGQDPRAASRRDVEHGAIYGVGAVKWTRTMAAVCCSRWLLRLPLLGVAPPVRGDSGAGTPDCAASRRRPIPP
jgi:hypothetical protein